METLQDFIARRKAELEAEIDRLRAELRQIVLAESVVTAGAPVTGEQQPVGTIKEQVVKILADSPRGLSAIEIQARLSERFDRIVKRESLSPQLSRLGAEGVLCREGKLWRLPVVGSALDRFRDGVEAREAQKGLVAKGALMLPLAAKENPQEVFS